MLFFLTFLYMKAIAFAKCGRTTVYRNDKEGEGDIP